MTKKQDMPERIYLQEGENRTGTEMCLLRWQYKPFEEGTQYTRTDKVEGLVLALGDLRNHTSMSVHQIQIIDEALARFKGEG